MYRISKIHSPNLTFTAICIKFLAYKALLIYRQPLFGKSFSFVDKGMKILVTNDDGIQSPGILILAEFLESLGEVWVVAPDRERTAISHAITLHHPLRIENIRPRYYAVDGTPTDCVNLGIGEILKEKPDLLVSGINKGGNMGEDITYSGTVSAALEGTIKGIPSFAISLVAKNNFKFEAAAAFAGRLVPLIIKKGLPSGTFLNVNIPETDGKEISSCRITRPGKRIHSELIIKNVDPRNKSYYWISSNSHDFEDIADSDFKAISQNQASITPIRIDLTDHATFKKLLAWDL